VDFRNHRPVKISFLKVKISSPGSNQENYPLPGRRASPLTIDNFSHLPFLYLIRGRGISLKFGVFSHLPPLYLIRARGISLKLGVFPQNFNLVLLIVDLLSLPGNSILSVINNLLLSRNSILPMINLKIQFCNLILPIDDTLLPFFSLTTTGKIVYHIFAGGNRNPTGRQPV